jgi:hypothetical protein
VAEGLETVPGSLYEVDGTDVPAVVPVAGKGYWLRSTTAHPAIFQGYSRLTITHTLQEGWNMVSGISDVMYLSEITDPGGIIVPGSLYDFNGTYADAGYIAPGSGYWVRAYETGDVTFTKAATAAKTREFQRFTDVNTLKVTNGNGHKTIPLYFGLTIADEKERLSYSMPPVPPKGAFDVRFANAWRYIENSGSLAIQDDSKELTIAYEIVDGSQWILSGDTQHLLEGSGEITITGNVSDLNLSKAGYEPLPDVFSLNQNFPNPFNPTTMLSYTLPEGGNVTIRLLDLRGRSLKTHRLGKQNAGLHSFTLDGRNLSSGSYIAQVEAAGSTLTQKISLIK